MQIKQLAPQEETETIIRIDYQERKLVIYTNKATIMNRLEKIGYSHKRQETADGEVYSREYEFSSKEIGKFLRTSVFKFD